MSPERALQIENGEVVHVQGQGGREACGSARERDCVQAEGEHPRLGGRRRPQRTRSAWKEYAKLVESLLDDEDGVEAEFSMLKCQMIEDGTYYA